MISRFTCGFSSLDPTSNSNISCLSISGYYHTIGWDALRIPGFCGFIEQTGRFSLCSEVKRTHCSFWSLPFLCENFILMWGLSFCTWVRAFLCKYECLYMYICVRMYVRVCICVYLYTYTYICVCVKQKKKLNMFWIIYAFMWSQNCYKNVYSIITY